MRTPQQPAAEEQHGSDGQRQDESDGAIGVHRTGAGGAAVRAAGAAWLPVIVWIALIAWLSGDGFSDDRTAAWLARWPVLAWLGVPPAVIGPANLILRKSAHFVEYAVLSLLTCRALARTAPLAGRSQRLAAALLLAFACALADEWHQATTLTRGGSLQDVALDLAGAFAGALLATYWRTLSRARVA